MTKISFIYTENGFIPDHPDDQIEDTWTQRFLQNKYEALFDFGFENDTKGFSGSALFLYHICESFIHALSAKPELEIAREQVTVTPDEDTIDTLLNIVPFCIGSEYVNSTWIKNLFKKLNEVYAGRIRKHAGTVASYLAMKSSDLKTARRIYFHLVENMADMQYPFAFLVTYATKDSAGRVLHVPLKQSLIEFKDDRNKLLNLLACLNDVADQVPMIAELMENGNLFHPIRLTSMEAFTLLKSVPIIEKNGIRCRVPNWWKKKYSSVNLNVTVGNTQPSLFGFASILQTQPSLVVNGKPLTKAEISAMLKMEEGLAFLKGQWVEINHTRLKQLLEQMENYDGTITLKEALTKNYLSEDEEDPDLGVQISNGKWLRDMLGKMRDPSRIRNKAKPKKFNAVLRPYQVDGYNWLNQMSELGFGACLADDMGLGKTVQVISYLEKLYETDKKSRALLIVPASLLGNWEKELQKFAPSLPYRIFHSTSAKEFSVETEPYFLLITTYGMAQRHEALQKMHWKCLILDEAQAIKNPGTKQTKTVKKIPSDMRIAMTGTPIENDLFNLWSLFDFLNKGLLGSSDDFKQYTKRLEVEPENMSHLKALVSPFILRRLKTDKSIISDLPDKVEITDRVELSRRQIVLYRKEVADMEKRLEEAVGMERRGLILSLLTHLKQICNHPDQRQKDDNWLPSDSGKFAMLKELCETIYEKRERVIIFTQYREMCQPLCDYLETVFHQKGLILHGGIRPAERTKLVARFNDPEHYVPYIVMSIKAGGTGLTLTAANHVIHFDRWWNPAVENQATDRAYRIGQKNNVFVHKLVSTGTIEEKIDQLLTSKQDLADSVLSSGADQWITEMSQEELMNLLRLDI